MYVLHARIPVLRPKSPLLAILGFFLLVWLLLAGAATAWAAAGAWSENEHARLRLISESESLGTQESLKAGLHFELAAGWKTYWRAPGDAGYPLTIDWSESQNLAAAELQWPVPHRFTLFGLDTFGYEEEVVFPLRLQPEDPGQPLLLTADVDYLLCKEICIPYQERVSLSLPPGTADPSPEAFLIELYRSQLPTSEEASGLSLERVGLLGRNGDLRLEARARSLFPFAGEPDLLLEGPEGLQFGRPQAELSEDGHLAHFRIPVTAGPGLAAEGADVRMTLVDGTRGLESMKALTRLAGPPEGRSEPQSLLLILGLALLGGLVLNLMPCVLPVLSLKLMSLISHGNSTPAAVRLSFLATAAGILFSFLLLAGGTIALKAAGAVVGWGIQFQQPLFLAAMAVVVTLFAANLFGFFEILLPGRLAQSASGPTTRGLGGAFATGAFATLLATPCSAPFLGTAVGFALSRGASEILMIFTALGIGLALPYLAVAAWPRVARIMPRPGRWMVWLRLLLGLALVGTALWLLAVLAVQLGQAAALALGVFLALLLALFAWRHFLSLPRPAFQVLATALVVAILGFAGLAGPNLEQQAARESHWGPFEREQISEVVAAGQTVLVDVTADWCITCQVNKARVLESDAIDSLLLEGSVTALRADWTRPDPVIADYLAAHGRYGIPFNVVYGPAAPEGILLPELLSIDAVERAIAEAAGGRS
ncbi:MAG TPA: protein-disulfide reductase DsbD domain-containing protein [Kiloniellales bacterium]|nr:protein-disulfide reductase DsbD domain-containing protein [Kiloniellales bacterium]